MVKHEGTGWRRREESFGRLLRRVLCPLIISLLSSLLLCV